MEIIARLSTSADGYVTTPDGWPAQLADPAFASGKSHGIQEVGYPLRSPDSAGGLVMRPIHW